MPEKPLLDLDVHRGAADLIAATLALFARHALLFLSVTLVIVAPAVILVAGVWAGGLWDGGDADVSDAAALVAVGALPVLLPVLVTALHVVVVRDLAEGRVPTVWAALRAAVPRFPHAVAAIVVYTLLVMGGFILLVIPGIWVFVAGYFAAQAAVMEGQGPLAAFRRSSELVEDRWFRTAGTLAFGWVLLTAASYPVGLAIGTVDSGLVYLLLYTLLEVLKLSLTALFGTLMYFSLRARKEHPFRSVPVAA